MDMFPQEHEAEPAGWKVRFPDVAAAGHDLPAGT